MGEYDKFGRILPGTLIFMIFTAIILISTPDSGMCEEDKQYLQQVSDMITDSAEGKYGFRARRDGDPPVSQEEIALGKRMEEEWKAKEDAIDKTIDENKAAEDKKREEIGQIQKDAEEGRRDKKREAELNKEIGELKKIREGLAADKHNAGETADAYRGLWEGDLIATNADAKGKGEPSRDPQYQTTDSKARWGLKKPNTPVFSGTPMGKNQESFKAGKGFGGGPSLPDTSNVRAGCVPDPTDPRRCASRGQTAAAGAAANLAQGTFGRGGGGGMPSLGSLLLGADKPAGFHEFEKAAPSEVSKPEGISLDKNVPLMGEKIVPGDEKERKAAELLRLKDYKGLHDLADQYIKAHPNEVT